MYLFIRLAQIIIGLTMVALYSVTAQTTQCSAYNVEFPQAHHNATGQSDFIVRSCATDSPCPGDCSERWFLHIETYLDCSLRFEQNGSCTDAWLIEVTDNISMITFYYQIIPVDHNCRWTSIVVGYPTTPGVPRNGYCCDVRLRIFDPNHVDSCDDPQEEVITWWERWCE